MDPKHLGFPDEEVMSSEDGLMGNHYYRDLRWADADDYHRWVTDAEELLEAEDPDDEDADFSDNEVWLLGLDPGVAPVVAALSAIGCCPVTSCSGGPGHYEGHPLVLVWCEQEHLTRIEQAAACVEGVEVEGVAAPGILIYTLLGPEVLCEFAQVLLRTGAEEPVPDHQRT